MRDLTGAEKNRLTIIKVRQYLVDYLTGCDLEHDQDDINRLIDHLWEAISDAEV